MSISRITYPVVKNSDNEERWIYLRLLAGKEVTGKKELYIFKKEIEHYAYRSTYAILKGQNEYSSEKFNYYWIKSDFEIPLPKPDSSSKVIEAPAISDCGGIVKVLSNKTYVGIRPVFSLNYIKNLKPFCKKYKDEGLTKFEFGYYPQEPTYFSFIEDDINKELSSGNLQKTGRTYNGDEEYFYEGDRFVRTLVTKDFQFKDRKYKKGDYAWFEVLPITWIFDKRSKLFISEKILYTGIPYTEVDDYLKTLGKEMLQGIVDSKLLEETKEEVKQIESKTTEVDSILEDIKKYLPYYHGKEDINKMVNDLLIEYNNNLDLINTSRRSNKINLEVSSSESLYTDLIIKLDNILFKLEKNYEGIKQYFDMIKIINESRRLLEKEEAVDLDNELYKDIKLISSVILPFIDDKEREEIRKDLIGILNIYSSDILSYLNSIEIFSDSSLKELKYYNTNEFELSIRKDIHNTLIKLAFYTNRKDLIGEINEEITNNINGIYKESNNSMVSTYLNAIYNIIECINNKVNIDKEYYSYYSSEMNNILNFNIDYSLSNEEVFGLLINVYSKLCKLEIELDNEIKVNNYKIKIKK